ncbi:MAG: hypothetical protein JXD22_00635 [Sedimentisphaerales bacterium]|nr:hypothetical protein [Sedimentisphaerales bacterium]
MLGKKEISDYLVILQAGEPLTAERLERAYQVSRARYERLTAERSGLRYYRKSLLEDVERAYVELKKTLADGEGFGRRRFVSGEAGTAGRKSVVARRVEQLGRTGGGMSGRISLAKERKINLQGRSIGYWQGRANQESRAQGFAGTGQEARQLSEPDKTAIEDAFCREVICRLEGDLIRYDSRLELLWIARQGEIHPFRANMLMAQIVEAVRQKKLYVASRREMQLWRKGSGGAKGNGRAENGDGAVQNEPVIVEAAGGVWGVRKAYLVVAAAIAVVIDVLLIRYLRG